MSIAQTEFDHFSNDYDQLLKDPIRNRFSPGGPLSFHVRKRDLIREYFKRRRIDMRRLAFLDVGCGRGELATLLRDDFGRTAGCDPSAGMLNAGGLNASGIDARVQEDPGRIPFGSGEFDFITAVCVFHHVPLDTRPALMAEMCRVLKPGGVLAIIEHNPWNPVTRLIVSRTPVDADAILLPPTESARLMRGAGLRFTEQYYFLYLPESLYRRLRFVESMLSRVPMGGQYAVFARSSR